MPIATDTYRWLEEHASVDSERISLSETPEHIEHQEVLVGLFCLLTSIAVYNGEPWREVESCYGHDVTALL